MSAPANSYDTIVLGGGAAGLFCAGLIGQGNEGRAGKSVLVLEKAGAVGKKILISGGGRCNFTNSGASAANFICANPHFAKSALARYTPADFIALVERYNIDYHEKTLGQLFCDGRSHQIVDMLEAECEMGQAKVETGRDVTHVAADEDGYLVTASGLEYRCNNLVIATGGPSIPKMGATGFAYDLARQFGLKVVEPVPALVPLTLGGEDVLFRDLSGVSAPVEASAGSGKSAMTFPEAALFTHRGLSGPAILQVSSYWKHGEPVAINFLPEADTDWLIAAKKANPRATVKSALTQHLSERLATTLAERLKLNGELANLPDAKLRGAQERLARWKFQPNGTEGFAKAEVTAGGISTAELSSQTMEAKNQPGLYAIGEAVDVTGWLGGYNFQWAWASAHAAAKAISA